MAFLPGKGGQVPGLLAGQIQSLHVQLFKVFSPSISCYCVILFLEISPRDYNFFLKLAFGDIIYTQENSPPVSVQFDEF